MLLLGIDTSGKSGGVTLAEAAERSFRVLGSSPIAGGTFSAQLVPTVASLLNQHHVSLRDLDGFSVVSGPGSFTGLRVGLSAVKGLAEVLHKPIVTVSLLELLASLSADIGQVIAALDAGRNQIFFGLYKVEDGVASEQSERLLDEAEFIEEMQKTGIAALISSDLRIEDLGSAAEVKTEIVHRPGSEQAARVGARKLLAGQSIAVEALDANYLRRSDAEIFFKGHR